MNYAFAVLVTFFTFYVLGAMGADIVRNGYGGEHVFWGVIVVIGVAVSYILVKE